MLDLDTSRPCDLEFDDYNLVCQCCQYVEACRVEAEHTSCTMCDDTKEIWMLDAPPAFDNGHFEPCPKCCAK